ncbi:MAG: hypothetical protein KME32_13100 [Mojavia pulchra JT2-VF2]|uniref:Uncharacterized protein n=1 Tax=Mojavia pulchra JT2-VF2 TaxID=287848 RepID=A0A951Q0E7_9NOST|nr:hypothetical protein [Mojavia pulchra JT2-VF2]
MRLTFHFSYNRLLPRTLPEVIPKRQRTRQYYYQRQRTRRHYYRRDAIVNHIVMENGHLCAIVMDD